MPPGDTFQKFKICEITSKFQIFKMLRIISKKNQNFKFPRWPGVRDKLANAYGPMGPGHWPGPKKNCEWRDRQNVNIT